jgi:hypothetical protein
MSAGEPAGNKTSIMPQGQRLLQYAKAFVALYRRRAKKNQQFRRPTEMTAMASKMKQAGSGIPAPLKLAAEADPVAPKFSRHTA